MLCRHPGGLGGFGWDCTGTQSADATHVTRQNVTQFSDWAVGFGVGPTVVNLQNGKVTGGERMPTFFLLLTLLLASATLFFYRRSPV